MCKGVKGILHNSITLAKRHISEELLTQIRQFPNSFYDYRSRREQGDLHYHIKVPNITAMDNAILSSALLSGA